MVTLSRQSLCPRSSITDKGMVVIMVSKAQDKKKKKKQPTHQEPTDLFHKGALTSFFSPQLTTIATTPPLFWIFWLFCLFFWFFC